MKKLMKNAGITLIFVICAIGIFFCMVGAVPESGLGMYIYLIFSAIFAILVPGLFTWAVNYIEYLEKKIDIMTKEKFSDEIDADERNLDKKHFLP